MMRKISLYIAISLDGYIADEKGGVDWLKGQEPNAENIDTYSTFIKDVDTVIMGWNTYHQVVTELSPHEWVYKGITSYIVTHRKQTSTEEIQFVNESPCKLVRQLKQNSGKNIWVCGGANIVQQLMSEELIDIFHICIIPVILGNGIRLFENGNKLINLNLTKALNYNGMTELIYEPRN